MKGPGHSYEVVADRRVRAPEYGTEAYQVMSHRTVFGFGVGKTYATGKEAKERAMAYAEALKDQASSVCIVKKNGYVGYGNYIKDSDELFETGWES